MKNKTDKNLKIRYDFNDDWANRPSKIWYYPKDNCADKHSKMKYLNDKLGINAFKHMISS